MQFQHGTVPQQPLLRLSKRPASFGVTGSVSAASDVRSDLVQLVLLSKRNSNTELASTTGLNNL